MDKLKDEFLMFSVQQIQNILTFTILYLRRIRLFTFPSWGVKFLSCTFSSLSSFAVIEWFIAALKWLSIFTLGQCAYRGMNDTLLFIDSTYKL